MYTFVPRSKSSDPLSTWFSVFAKTREKVKAKKFLDVFITQVVIYLSYYSSAKELKELEKRLKNKNIFSQFFTFASTSDEFDGLAQISSSGGEFFFLSLFSLSLLVPSYSPRCWSLAVIQKVRFFSCAPISPYLECEHQTPSRRFVVIYVREGLSTRRSSSSRGKGAPVVCSSAFSSIAPKLARGISIHLPIAVSIVRENPTTRFHLQRNWLSEY